MIPDHYRSEVAADLFMITRAMVDEPMSPGTIEVIRRHIQTYLDEMRCRGIIQTTPRIDLTPDKISGTITVDFHPPLFPRNAPMSAQIVSKEVIDILVSGMVQYQVPMISRDNGAVFVNENTAKLVGSMLWMENIKSYQHCYKHISEEVIRCQQEAREVKSYEPVLYTKVTPIGLAKTISYYDHQTCEHDEWESSAAHNAMAALASKLKHINGAESLEAMWDTNAGRMMPWGVESHTLHDVVEAW